MLATPLEIMRMMVRNRALIRQMAVRDIAAKYKGSVAGIAWAFINPILMLLVYTFVFAVVFQARWPGVESKSHFTLVLFCGLILFSVFSECTNRAASLIHAHVNFVKRVRFPLEILVPVTVVTALFHAGISLLVLLVAMLILKGSVPVTFLLSIVVILPCVFLSLGMGWIVSAIAVYLRDTSQVVAFATTALMFLSPLFFPPQAIPEQFQSLLALNPLAQMIQDFRGVALFGEAPELSSWLLSLLFSYVFAWVGLLFFMRLRRGFSDVL